VVSVDHFSPLKMDQSKGQGVNSYSFSSSSRSARRFSFKTYPAGSRSRRCDSVYLVHFNVHQNPVRKTTVICIESFGAVATFLNFTHHVADHSSDQAAHGHVIVHN